MLTNSPHTFAEKRRRKKKQTKKQKELKYKHKLNKKNLNFEKEEEGAKKKRNEENQQQQQQLSLRKMPILYDVTSLTDIYTKPENNNAKIKDTALVHTRTHVLG